MKDQKVFYGRPKNLVTGPEGLIEGKGLKKGMKVLQNTFMLIKT